MSFFFFFFFTKQQQKAAALSPLFFFVFPPPLPLSSPFKKMYAQRPLTEQERIDQATMRIDNPNVAIVGSGEGERENRSFHCFFCFVFVLILSASFFTAFLLRLKGPHSLLELLMVL